LENAGLLCQPGHNVTGRQRIKIHGKFSKS
jgi:hypothetical protein